MNSQSAISIMRQSFLATMVPKLREFPIGAFHAAITRECVAKLEAEMLKREQVELPIFHHFADGLYMRELHIPKGVTSTGKIHKHEHFGILTKGVRDMLIDGEVKTVAAPFMTAVKAGSKLACYTWEDSIYVTIHPNPDDERDIPTLEARYVCDTEQEYLEYVASSQKVIECHS